MSSEKTLHIMIFAAASDAEIKEIEVTKIMHITNTHHKLKNHDKKTIRQAIKSCLAMLNREGSVEACVDIISQIIDENEKKMAYSLAWEVCAADYVIGDYEMSFLNHLKNLFGIPDDVEGAIKTSLKYRYLEIENI